MAVRHGVAASWKIPLKLASFPSEEKNQVSLFQIQYPQFYSVHSISKPIFSSIGKKAF